MLNLVKDFEVVASLENNLEIKPCIGKLEVKPFLLEIGQVIDTLIKRKLANSLFFHLNIDKYLTYINTDSVRLKQILINLLSNSVKFSSSGAIELKVEVIKTEVEDCIFKSDNNIVFKVDANIEKSKALSKALIRFSVIDSGKGISESLLNLINSEINVKAFKKDTSVNNNLGTGYGLNIVQKLCKVLKSKLYAIHNKSLSGKSFFGTIFYFDIPQEHLILLNENDYVDIPNYNTDNIASKTCIENNIVKEKERIKSNYFNLDDKLVFDKFKKENNDHLMFSIKHFSEEVFDFNKLTFNQDDTYVKYLNHPKDLKHTSLSPLIFPKFNTPCKDRQENIKTNRKLYDLNLPKAFIEDIEKGDFKDINNINLTKKEELVHNENNVVIYLLIFIIYRIAIQALKKKDQTK